MKLRRIEIENVRRLKGPIVIDQLNDGINLFTGPNGSGKSSLVAAIRAAFFERYKSSSVTLRPHDDTSVSPRIGLQFEMNGERYELTKQFFTGKRCALRVGSKILDGEDAESHLSELLGYTYAGKGASQAHHWGIPGLLWIEQGTGQELTGAVDYARDRLQSALQAMVGAVASTGGDAVIQSLESQRREIVTAANNNPRGDYAVAKRELDELDAAILELASKLSTYQDDVDRLARDDRELREIDATKPWEDLEARAKAASAAAENASLLQQELQSAKQAVDEAEKLITIIHSQAQEREAIQAALPRARERLSAADEQHARATQVAQAATTAYKEASESLASARRTLQLARAAAKRALLDRQIREDQERHERLLERQVKANELATQLAECNRDLAASALPDGAIDTIRRLTNEIRDLDIKLEVVGTKVAYQIEPGTTATLDGQALSGAGAQTLQQEAVFQAAGIRLHLTPGSTGLGDLRTDRDAKQAELDQLLSSLGLPSTAAAEKRAAAHAQSLQDERTLKLQLSQIAPDGTDALALEISGADGRVQALEAELASLPSDDGTPIPSLEDATAAETLAADFKDDRRDEQAAAETQLTLATSEKQSAEDEVQRLEAQLQSSEWEATSRNLSESLAAAGARKREASARAQSAQDKLESIDVAQLNQDVRRFTASAQQAREAHARLSRSVLTLRTQVEMLGGEGIEERLANLRVKREKAATRVTEFGRQVQVIDYLLGDLERRRDALRQQLVAPLQIRIDHYLRTLMPGRRLQLSEDLSPQQLVNDADSRPDGGFDTQSFGTREQLALICRLAYADLLKESGAPTLLILDDALVHTDDDRLDAMKRVLFDAAERHQILMMTCHPERWRDLGAQPTAMEELVRRR